MRRLALVLAAGAMLAGGSAAVAREKLTGEQQLAKLLDGRVAGKPIDCISLAESHDQRVIDKTAIVYGSGRTIYVNRPTNADSLNDDDILVSEIDTGQVCDLDVVRLHDRADLWFTGFVGLQQFVPYTRVADAN